MSTSQNPNRRPANQEFLASLGPSVTLNTPADNLKVREAALDCVGRGWYVLPVEPNGKLPESKLVSHGVNSATNDPEVVKGWFVKMPNINFAVAGGNDSDLSFYDYDELYNDDTNVDFPGSQFPGLYKSYRVRSGRILKPGQVGGFHLYTKGSCKSRALFADANIPLTTRPGVKKDGSPLLDKNGNPIMQTFDRHDRLVVNGRVTVGEVRSRGEYVVGYGSHHKSGRDYELVADAPLFQNPIHDVEVVNDTPAIGTYQQNEIAGYVEEALDKSKIEYTARQDYQGGFKWLVSCPWEHEHTGGKTLEDGGSSSAVFMTASGALGYRCLHAHCQTSRNWEQFRKYMESIAGKLSFIACAAREPKQIAENCVESGTSPTQTMPAEPPPLDGIDEEDAPQSDDKSVPYPDMGVDDAVSLFAKELADGTSMPIGYLREPLKNMTNMLLAGYFVHPAHPSLCLRGNAISVGEPESTKTTALQKYVERWMRPLFEARGIWIRDLFKYKSEPVFIKNLSRTEDRKGRQGNPHQWLHITEGYKVVTANEYFKAVFALLTDLYDQEIAETESFRNGDWSASDVQLSTYICFTPKNFYSATSGNGAVGSGGLARWCLVYPLKIFRRDDWAQHSDAHLTEVFQHIANRAPDPNQETVMLTEEAAAKEIRLDMKEELVQAGMLGDRLGEYFIREQVNQAVFSFDRPNVITRDATERIALWTRAQVALRKNLWAPDAGNVVERAGIAMRERLNQQGAHLVSETQLKDAMHYWRDGSGGAWAYLQASTALVTAKDIKVTGCNRKGFKLFCRYGCPIHPAVSNGDYRHSR